MTATPIPAPVPLVSDPQERRRLWWSVLPAMLLPAVGAVLYYRVLSGQSMAPYAYSTIKLFLLGWPLLAVWLIDRRGLLLTGGGVKKHLRAIAPGLLSGVAFAFLIIGLYVWSPLGEAVQQCGHAIKARVAGLGVLPYYVPFAIFLSLGHSLLEEYYWRWFVSGRLALLLPLRAALPLSGVAFALHHFVVLNGYFGVGLALLCTFGVAAGGTFWAWQLRRQGGTLLGVWASHALTDGAIMVIGYQQVMG